MTKKATFLVLVALALNAVPAFGQQADPSQIPPRVVPKPTPKSLPSDIFRRYLLQLGATINDAKSTNEMIVSSYVEPKGGKTLIVIADEPGRDFVSFYVYGFGELGAVTKREEIYKYLLFTNKQVLIGSFFVDEDDDIGYTYRISTQQRVSQAVFAYIYLTIATISRTHRPEIKRLIEQAANKDGKPDGQKSESQKKP